ncbi:MAG: nucleotidyltransferase [Gemmatimonadales bacterium]|nr:nucleotidyltransferase [Gemmatimonadales bacterium]
MSDPDLTHLTELIVDHIDIPESYYKKAAARHRSVGDWLCRPESAVSRFEPQVSSQGSFRYGTVIMPVVMPWEYDLDNVTRLNIRKTDKTQREVKTLYGDEVRKYATANSIIAPVEEMNRCWRLKYADEVSFHLDTLPCVSEEAAIIEMIVARGAPRELADLAIAITDRRHPQYDSISRLWPSSNPQGFAKYFEMRALSGGGVRRDQLVKEGFYSSIEDVPPYEWKTPLQRSIQLMKRHRDVMFREDPGRGPISMILTNLGARAYQGELDLWAAFSGIVERMPLHINKTLPRVPNPADPAEDYADKWARNSQKEEDFWMWHKQLLRDVESMKSLIQKNNVVAGLRAMFRVEVTQEELGRLNGGYVTRTKPIAAAAVHIQEAPRPWAKCV